MDPEMSNLINQAIGVVTLALTTLITALVPIAALYLKKKWGLDIDEKQRAQLVSAINNGIAYGAEIAKARQITNPAAVESVQVNAAREYVQQMAPAALKHFKLDAEPDKLEKKIVSQLAPAPQAKDAIAVIVPTTQEGKTP